MMLYIKIFVVETNPMEKENIQTVQEETVGIVENLIHGEIAQNMERNAKNVAKTITSKLCVKVDPLINAIQADQDPKRQG